MLQCVWVGVRGQRVRVGSGPSPSGSWGSNSGYLNGKRLNPLSHLGSPASFS